QSRSKVNPPAHPITDPRSAPPTTATQPGIRPIRPISARGFPYFPCRRGGDAVQARAMATIAVFGTLDSKGLEHAFVADAIRSFGHEPLLIDAGCLGAPQVDPDIRREEIAPELADLPEDRGARVAAMAA